MLTFGLHGVAEPTWSVASGGDGGVRALVDGDEVQVTTDAGTWELEYRPQFAPRAHAADDEAHPGAPMPGRVVTVQCEVGQHVAPGQPLLVLEAMKMEYTLQARVHGTVSKVLFAVGDMVDAEVPLVEITPDE